MIQHFPKQQLGHEDYGWLKTYYHFSFANYFNPNRMGHGALRVLNDDLIAPQTGFDRHSHRDMEIISVVRQGAISHKDSAGNEGKTMAGDVQVISAGTGIFHGEHNLEKEVTHLYQIWIEPRNKGLTPRWAQAHYEFDNDNSLELLVAGDSSAPLQINQDAKIYLGQLNKASSLKASVAKYTYLVVFEGGLKVNDIVAFSGDGMAVTDEAQIVIDAITTTQFLLISLEA